MWAVIGIASAVLLGSVLIYHARVGYHAQVRRRAKDETLRNLVELLVEPQKAANDNDARLSVSVRRHEH